MAVVDQSFEQLAARFIAAVHVDLDRLIDDAGVLDVGLQQQVLVQLVHGAERANDDRALVDVLAEELLERAGLEDLAALDEDSAGADLGQLGKDVGADEDGLALAGEDLEEFAQLDASAGSRPEAGSSMMSTGAL